MVKVGDKIQVEIREIDDRGKLSLVPVEVVEREAAAGNGDGGRAARPARTVAGTTGPPEQGGGDSHRTRHRERRHSNNS